MRVTRYRPALLNEPGTWPAGPARFQTLLDEFFARPGIETLGWSPAVDIVDADGELRLTAELPGMKKEDIAVEVKDGMLTLKGEKKSEKEEEKAHYRLVERTFGAFERTFTLPRSVDAEKVKAEFANGVLTVHLPQSTKALGRTIDIAVK